MTCDTVALRARAVNRAWWAVVGVFLVHGLLVSTWISRIPAIQTALHLNNGILGMTLLSSALGAVTSMPLTAQLVNRFGSKRITTGSTMALCCALVILGLATSVVTLAGSLFLFGAVAAAMGVSMNAQAVEVEKRLGTPTMSRFHALFSTGAMAGAAIGGWAAGRQTAPLLHFGVSAAINAAAVIGLTPLLLDCVEAQTADASAPKRLHLTRIPPILFALSAIAFCILLSEGAMEDWIAVYFRQVLRSGEGKAALGYSVFSAAMATFRFAGDWITRKLGTIATVRYGAAIGACGVFCAVLATSPRLAYPSFALVGIGLSVIIPLVFGSGGRVRGVSPGPGIATVTGFGYIGFIVGPPSIGFVSQIVTLRFALLIVAGCCIAAAILSRCMRSAAASPGHDPVELLG